MLHLVTFAFGLFRLGPVVVIIIININETLLLLFKKRERKIAVGFVGIGGGRLVMEWVVSVLHQSGRRRRLRESESGGRWGRCRGGGATWRVEKGGKV